MSADAGAGPQLKRDRWGTVALLRLPKRRVYLIAPFVLESKNSNRANPFRQGDNVEEGRVGGRVRRSNLHCLLHWTG